MPYPNVDADEGEPLLWHPTSSSTSESVPEAESGLGSFRLFWSLVIDSIPGSSFYWDVAHLNG
jgi:hypothetical protein